MKKWINRCLLLIALVRGEAAKAQAQEAQQLLLNVEKLAQLKNILEDLKKGYEVVYRGYTTIKRLSEGNFELHDLFLQGLLQVSPTVSNYKRIGEIVQGQLALVSEYKKALRLFRESGLLRPEELDYISTVFNKLLKRSLQNLDDLAMVVTAGTLRMTDAERLTAIDAVWAELQESRTFLRRFNNEAKVLLVQRATGREELSSVKSIYSINK